MKDEWRLIWEDGAADCYYNMGLDKAILEAVSKSEVPNTIRFYRWSPSAVSIGYFQSMNKVIDVENCKKYSIDFIRRITGGGAVYHDYEGELTYSVNCRLSDQILPHEIIKIYEKICGGIVKGLKILGIDAEFKPINDIALRSNGKKISGSALTKRDGTILQHGTILRQVNVEKMFSVLIVPDIKIVDKLISSAKERVSSLELELGEAPSFKEIGEAFISGLTENLGIELSSGKLTPNEIDNTQKNVSELFKKHEWLFKR